MTQADGKWALYTIENEIMLQKHTREMFAWQWTPKIYFGIFPQMIRIMDQMKWLKKDVFLL